MINVNYTSLNSNLDNLSLSSIIINITIGTLSYGTNGYIKFCTFKNVRKNINCPIQLYIIQRGIKPYLLTVMFDNQTGYSGLYNISTNSQDPNIAIVNVSDGTWDLYVKKVEGYDTIYIPFILFSTYLRGRITYEFKEEFVLESNMPTENITYATYEN